MGGCDGVVGTGGGGGPGRFRVVLCRGGAWQAGARAAVDSLVRAQGLRLGVGLGLAVAAVAGHLLYVCYGLEQQQRSERASRSCNCTAAIEYLRSIECQLWE